jgi:ankyrin repeat protein
VWPGSTALILASGKGHVEAIRILLSHGADVHKVRGTREKRERNDEKSRE